ncbi:MAG TPA: hypothetical protein VJQ58_06845 [Burkholderiales bacterium]|nr:hypothetical protein [Burkholderiales bacterium]
MASFQNIGGPVTIAPGGTHYWDFWFGSGLDVGAVSVTPNILESQINVRLVTSELGVRTVQTRVEEGVALILYTVAVHNKGAAAIKYNLDIGTFQ